MGNLVYKDSSHNPNNIEIKKTYKIKYTVNLLPAIDEEDESIMDILGETDNIDVFHASVVKGLLDFKWTKYASRVHKLSAVIHILYIILFLIYVDRIYLYKDVRLKT